jgi:hypothetical protein
LQAPYNVVRYEMTEESSDKFMVDEVSGEVFLKQTLTADDAKTAEYKVTQYPNICHLIV